MTAAGTLLYDPHCGFCTRIARLARLLSRRRLGIAGIDDGIARGSLAGIPPERAWATMHHVAPDGTVRSGPAGVAPVVACVPGGRALVALLRRVPGADRANARLYHALAHRRSPECRHGPGHERTTGTLK